MAATHQDLARQLTELQDKTKRLAMQHDTFSHNTRNQIRRIFEALHDLMTPPPAAPVVPPEPPSPPKRPIGCVPPEDKSVPKAVKIAVMSKLVRKR